MPRVLHHDRMVKLFQRALAGGARRVSVSRCEWTISGDCSKPYHTAIIGRPRDDNDGHGRPSRWHTSDGHKITMQVDLWTRCRKCDNCARARFREWRYRAREEIRRAARTWFGTLTLAPVHHYRVMVEARRQAAIRSIKWSDLSDEERFKRIADASLKEVTRYFKRVRKQSKVPIRYICVTERHKSGLPHFHVLIHETELRPVPHRILSAQWTWGFEKWRLVHDEDQRAAMYVTKYITKEARLRIRASQAYGKPDGLVGPLLAHFKNAS